MNCALELPRLAAVPRHYTLRTPAPDEACAALALHDAGLLDRAIAAPAAELLHRGLLAWLERHTGGTEPLWWDIVWLREDSPGHQCDPVVSISCPEPPHYLVGPRLTRIEADVPGLGTTALHWITEAGVALNADIITPTVLAHWLSMMQWGYSRDERELVEQAQANGETWDGITRAYFEADFPAWSFRLNAPARGLIKANRLRGSADSAHEPLVANAARLTLELRQAVTTFRRRPFDLGDHFDNAPAQPLIMLAWSKDDLTTRLIDDWYYDLAEAGEHHEEFARTTLDGHTDTDLGAQLVAWLRKIERIFPVVRAALALCDHLKEPT